MNGKKAKAQRRLERNKALFDPQLGKVLHEEMLIESGQQQVPIKTMSLGGYKAALEKVTSGVGVVGTTPRIPDVVEDGYVVSEAEAQQLSDLQQANKYDAKILEQLNRTSKHYFDIGVEGNAAPKHEPFSHQAGIPEISGYLTQPKPNAAKYPFKFTDDHSGRGVACRIDPDAPVDSEGRLSDIVILGGNRFKLTDMHGDRGVICRVVPDEE